MTDPGVDGDGLDMGGRILHHFASEEVPGRGGRPTRVRLGGACVQHRTINNMSVIARPLSASCVGGFLFLFLFLFLF